jgi:hypothetical protein
MGASTAAEPSPSGVFERIKPLRRTTKEKVWELKFLLMYVSSFSVLTAHECRCCRDYFQNTEMF